MNNLYHYCSNDTFTKIVSSHELRLSAMSLSNDSYEGHMFVDLLEEILEEKFNPKVAGNFKKVAKTLLKFSEGYGFCLSEHSDMLSQWRGYANDGKGISLGISKDVLQPLCTREINAFDNPPCSLLKIEYEWKKQKERIIPLIQDFEDLLESGLYGENHNKFFVEPDQKSKMSLDQEKLLAVTTGIMTHLFSYKKSAFQEEAEWRIIHTYSRTNTKDCCFYAKDSVIIPFKKFNICKSNKKWLNKVVIGPKNETPKYVIESVLKSEEFKEVEVIKSDASYR